jgi:lipopolysaccharide export system permease protein
MKTLDRYILETHLGPFAFGFFVTTGVLFTEVLKNFLDDFLAKGVAAWTIAEVLLLSLGHTLALSVPMAVLVATLLAFGQMAQDHELTALKASGVSLYRVMAPVFIASVLLCGGMLVFTNYVLPESNHRLAGLIHDIARTRPVVSMEPGIFVDDFDGYKFIIGDKREGTDEILDVRVFADNDSRAPDIYVAPHGRLYFDNGGRTLNIVLRDGYAYQVPESEDRDDLPYRITAFKEHQIIITDAKGTLERTNRTYRSDREMTIEMMKQSIGRKHGQIADAYKSVDVQARRRLQNKLAFLDATERTKLLRARPRTRPGSLMGGAESRLRDLGRNHRSSVDSYERQIRSLQVEIHKKYSIPAACIVFVLLGAPLAILSGRSGMTMTIAFSIACFAVYYLFLTGGEKLADRRYLSPFWAMWAANIVFGALGAFLAWRSAAEITVFNYRRLDPRTWWPLNRSRGRRHRPPSFAS